MTRQNSRIERQPGVLTFQHGTFVLSLSIALYVLIIGYLSILRYATFQAGMFDLGIMEQVLWNTSHGRILTESVNMGYPISRMWSGRWELIYLPVSLIHRMFPHPATGLMVQTIFLALGALPIYWLSNDILGRGALATTIPILYLLYPPMHNANLFDIHGITFAIPLFLFAFHFLRKGRTGLFCLFTGLLLMCREDASFLVFMLGLYAAVFEKRRITGLSIAVTAVIWFLSLQNVQLLRPIIGLPPVYDPSMAPSRWEHLGGSSPASFITTVFANPLAFLSSFLDVANLKLSIKLLGPLAFLSILSPTTLLIMLPNLVINMISDSPVVKNIYHHYTATIVPVVFVSLVLGIRNLRRFRWRSRQGIMETDHHRWAGDRWILPLLIIPTFLSFFLWSMIWKIEKGPAHAHYRVIEEISETIPQGASLSTHFLIAPHVAHRENLYLLPDRIGEVEYVFYDFWLPYTRLMSRISNFNPPVPPVNDAIHSLLRDHRYGITVARDGAVIFHKGADYRKGLKKLASTGGLDLPSPLSTLRIGSMELKGISPPRVTGYSGQQYHFVLIWEMLHGIEGSKNPGISLILERDEQRFPYTHEPLFGLLDQVEWEEGEILRDDLFIPIDGLSPGDYLLSAEVSSEDGTITVRYPISHIPIR